METIKIYESLLLESKKEAEKSKQKYIIACRERGISEEEIKRRINQIEKIANKAANDLSDKIIRKVSKTLEMEDKICQ